MSFEQSRPLADIFGLTLAVALRGGMGNLAEG
jgi:hypothetical protein